MIYNSKNTPRALRKGPSGLGPWWGVHARPSSLVCAAYLASLHRYNKHNPVDRTKAHLPYILPLLKEAVQWLHYNSPDYCMSAPEAPSIPQFSPLQELSE